MRKTFYGAAAVIAVAHVFVAGCGGGTSNGTSTNGMVVDAPVQGGKVNVTLLDGRGAFLSFVGSTQTDVSGAFAQSLPGPGYYRFDCVSGTFVGQNGLIVDVSTRPPILSAIATGGDSIIISPITTFELTLVTRSIAAGRTAGDAITGANAAVGAMFAVPVSSGATVVFDPLHTVPVNLRSSSFTGTLNAASLYALVLEGMAQLAASRDALAVPPNRGQITSLDLADAMARDMRDGVMDGIDASQSPPARVLIGSTGVSFLQPQPGQPGPGRTFGQDLAAGILLVTGTAMAASDIQAVANAIAQSTFSTPNAGLPVPGSPLPTTGANAPTLATISTAYGNGSSSAPRIRARGGDVVTLTGSGFDQTTVVFFGPVQATVTSVAANGSTLTAVSNAGTPGLVDVSVRNGPTAASILNGLDLVGAPVGTVNLTGAISTQAGPGTTLYSANGLVDAINQPVLVGETFIITLSFTRAAGGASGAATPTAPATVLTTAASGFSFTLTPGNTTGSLQITVNASPGTATGNTRLTINPAPSTVATPSVTLSTGGVNQLIADPSFTATLTGVVKDAFGNMVPDGTSVTLTATLGFINGVALGPVFVTTTGGTYTAVYAAATTTGVATITANSYSTSFGVQVTLIPGFPTSIVNLQLSKVTLTADGDSVTMTGTVLDKNRNPVLAGIEVDFAVLGTLPPMQSTAPHVGQGSLGTFTLANGNFSGVFQTTGVAGPATLTAVINAAPASSVQAQVTVNPGVPAALNLLATPATVKAGSSPPVAMSGVVKDKNNNNVPGVAVTLATTAGTFTNGQASFQFVSTGQLPIGPGAYFASLNVTQVAQIVLVTASTPPIQQTVAINVIPNDPFSGVIAPTLPQLTVNTPSSGNGRQTAVTATFRDQFQNLIATGTAINFFVLPNVPPNPPSLGSLSSNNQLAAGGSGTVNFIAGPKIGVAQIQATAGAVAVTTTVTLNPDFLTTLSIFATPGNTVVNNVQGGTTQWTITGTAVDVNQNPVAPTTVALMMTAPPPGVLTLQGGQGGNPSGNPISFPTGNLLVNGGNAQSVSGTFSNGFFAALITSVTQTGTYTVTVSDPTNRAPPATVSVSFIPDNANPISALSVDQARITVRTSTTVRGVARDRFGNLAAAGQQVGLAISNGNGTFTPATAITVDQNHLDSMGNNFQATLTAGTSTATSPETITATGPTGTPPGNQRTVTIIFNPAAADHIFPFTAAPKVIGADPGTVIVTGVARDRDNNPVLQGTQINLTPSSGGPGIGLVAQAPAQVLTQPTPGPDPNFPATGFFQGFFQTTGVAGTATAFAVVNGITDPSKIASDTVTVLPGAVRNITVVSSPPASVVNRTVSITGTLTDRFGNTVLPGVPVSLSANNGGQLGTTSTTTNGSGQYATTLTGPTHTATVTITVTSGSATQTATVFFAPDVPASLVLTPLQSTLVVANPPQTLNSTVVNALVRDQFGNAVADGTTVTCSVVQGASLGTLNQSIQFSGNGNANFVYTTARRTGVASLFATAGGVSGTATITLNPDRVKTITLFATANIPNDNVDNQSLVTAQFTITGTAVDGNSNPVLPTRVAFALTSVGGATVGGSVAANPVLTSAPSNPSDPSTTTGSFSVGVFQVTTTATINVVASDPTGGAPTVSIPITLRPGQPTSVTLNPPSSSSALVQVGAAVAANQITVSGVVRDQFGNTVATGTAMTFGLAPVDGSISSTTTFGNGLFQSVFTAGISAAPGVAPAVAPATLLGGQEQITASSGSGSASQNVTLLPNAAAQILVVEVLDNVGGQTTANGPNPTITGIARDANGNRVLGGAQIDITMTQQFNPFGQPGQGSASVLTNGAGTFTQFLQTTGIQGVATIGSNVHGNPVTNTANHTITVVPGPVQTVTLASTPPSTTVGSSVLLSGTVSDSFGNRRAGDTVTLTASAGTLAQATTTTSSTGQFSMTLVGPTHTAMVLATALAGTGTAQTNVFFGPLPPASASNNPPGVVVTATNPVLVANGRNNTAITALVRDQYGNPVADGTPVSFNIPIGPGFGTLNNGTNATANTISGSATVTYTTGTRSSQSAIIVQATSGGTVGTVSLTLNPDVLSRLAIFATPASTTVNNTGVLQYTITGTALDVNSNPVLPTAVALTLTNGAGVPVGGNITNPTMTAGPGASLGTFIASVSNVTLTASRSPVSAVVTDPNGVAPAASVSLTFLPAPPASLVLDSHVLPTLTVSVPSGLPSFSPPNNTAIVSGTVFDQFGNLVAAGNAISFSVTGNNGSFTVTSTAGTTGRFQTTLTAGTLAIGTVAQRTQTVTASAAPAGSDSATVLYNPNIADHIQAGFTDNVNGVITADGPSVIVTGVALDADNNPVLALNTNRVDVSMTQQFSPAIVAGQTILNPTTCQVTTQANGLFSATLATTGLAGNAQVAAFVDETARTNAGATSLQSPNSRVDSITVNPGALATIAVAATTATATVGQTVGITGTAVDRFRNGVLPGTPITLTATNAGLFVGSPSVTVSTVGSGGAFSASLTGPTHTATVLVTATGPNGVTGTTSVFFGPGAPASVAVVAQSTVLVANGVSNTAVTALVLDANGNTVANGTSVLFNLTSNPGLGVVSPALTSTTNGVAATNFRANTTSGSVVVQAIAGGVSSTATITLNPDVLNRLAIGAVAANTTVNNTGVLQYTITGTAQDRNGNAVLAQNVNLALTNGAGSPVGGTITNPTMTANGTFIASVSNVTLTASRSNVSAVVSDPAGVAASASVALTFQPAAPNSLVLDSHALPAVTVSVPSGFPSFAPPNNTTIVSGAVFDQFGNLVAAGNSVQFTVTDPSSVVNGAVPATSTASNGRFQSTLTTGTRALGTVAQRTQTVAATNLGNPGQDTATVLYNPNIADHIAAGFTDNVNHVITADGPGVVVTGVAVDADNNPVLIQNTIRVDVSMTQQFTPVAMGPGQTIFNATTVQVATQANGLFSATLPTSGVAGNAQANAFIDEASRTAAGASALQVPNFQADAITVNPGALARISVSPTTATATVGQTVAITGTAVDSHGNGVPAGTPITLTASNAGLFGASSSTTVTTAGTGGAFGANLTGPTHTATVLVTAAGPNGVTGTTSVFFGPGVPASVQLTVGPPSTLSTDRPAQTTQVHATVLDANGNNVADQTLVTFNVQAPNPTGSSINPLNQPTFGGVANVVFTAGTIAGNATVTASSGAVSGTASVTLIPGTIARIVPVATAVNKSVDAFGATQYTVTGTAFDAQNNPVGVTVVSLAIAGGTVNPPTVATGAGGVFGAPVTAALNVSGVTHTGNALLTVSGNGPGSPSAQLTLAFTAGAPATVVVGSNPPTVVVGTQSTISGTVTDQFNNLVPGATVLVGTTSGANGEAVTPTSVVTAVNGTFGGVQFTAGTIVGTEQVTASAAPAPLATLSISVIGGPAFGNVTFSATPFPFMSADGVSTVTVTSTPVRDRFGNVVATGTAFSLGAAPLGTTPTLLNNLTTDGTGRLSYLLRAGTTAGSGVVQATAQAPGTATGAFSVTLDAVIFTNSHPNNIPSSPGGSSQANGRAFVLSGDMNQDGKLDVVWVHPAANGPAVSVDIIRGDGTGNFVATISTTALLDAGSRAIQSVFSAALVDMNRDGIPDIVVTAIAPSVSNLLPVGMIYLGTPAGFGSPSATPAATFTPVAGQGYGFVRVGDLDRDARPDLVFLRGDGASTYGVDVYLQNRDLSPFPSPVPPQLGFNTGAFSSTAALGGTPTALVVGDVTLDGWPDVIVATATASAQSFTVFENDQTGAIGGVQTRFASTFQVNDMVVTDINQDGANDVILVGGSTTGPSVGQISVQLNTRFTGASRFTTQPSFSISNSKAQVLGSILAAELFDRDQDGNPDLAIASANLNGQGIFLSVFSTADLLASRVSSMTTVWDAQANAQSGSFAVGDYDRDGFPDLVAEVNTLFPPLAAPTATLTLMSGGGSFPATTSFSSSNGVFSYGTFMDPTLQRFISPVGVFVGDLTIDGSVDIGVIHAESTTAMVQVLNFDRAQVTASSGAHQVTNGGNVVTFSAVADVFGAVGVCTPQVADFLLNGRPSVAYFQDVQQGPSATGQVNMLVNNGFGVYDFEGPPSLMQNRTVAIFPVMVAGDFAAANPNSPVLQGQDVFALDPTTNFMQVWVNDGSGVLDRNLSTTLTGVPIPDARLGGTVAVSGDFNGDGFTDVAYLTQLNQATTAQSLVFLPGNPYDVPTGTYFSAAQIVTTTGLDMRAIGAGDFDEDGRDDVVIITDEGQAILATFPATGPSLQPISSVSQGAHGGRFVVVGDFNRDGHLDFVRVVLTGFRGSPPAQQGANLDIFYGNGDGTFRAPVHVGATTTTSGHPVRGVAVADVDGNGVPDIILLENDQLEVFFGTQP